MIVRQKTCMTYLAEMLSEFGIEDDRKSTHTNLTWYCFPFFLLLLLLLVWHSIYNNILYFIQYHMSYWVGVPKMIHVTMYTKWVKCSSKGLSVAHKRLDILTNIWKHCTNIKLETEKQYFFPSWFLLWFWCLSSVFFYIMFRKGYCHHWTTERYNVRKVNT